MNRIRSVFGAFPLVAAGLLLAEPATAGAWNAFEDGQRCISEATPSFSKGAAAGRDDAYLAVTHDRAEGTFDAVSFVSGFDATEIVGGTAKIGGREFDLLPFGGAGFVKGGSTEQGLISSLKDGDQASVTWFRPDGSQTVDTYSLSGFTAAYNRIGQLCGR